MHTRSGLFNWFGVATVMMLVSLPGAAQTARSGGGAVAQLMLQLQQLTAERTSLAAENTKLQSELDALSRDRDEQQKGAESAVRRIQTAVAARAKNLKEREVREQELTEARAHTQELIDKFRQTVQSLRQVETETASARQTLATRQRDLASCVQHDLGLAKLNEEILVRFDRESTWTRLARGEPFTRLMRIEHENQIDEYQATRQDLREYKRSAGTLSSAGAFP